MEIAAAEQPDKQPRKRGRPFVAGVSGNPLGRRALPERAAALYAELAGDFPNATATETTLLKHACLCLAKAQSTGASLDAMIRLTSVANRIISTLRKAAAAAAERTAPAGEDEADEPPIDEADETADAGDGSTDAGGEVEAESTPVAEPAADVPPVTDEGAAE